MSYIVLKMKGQTSNSFHRSSSFYILEHKLSTDNFNNFEILNYTLIYALVNNFSKSFSLKKIKVKNQTILIAIIKQ